MTFQQTSSERVPLFLPLQRNQRATSSVNDIHDIHDINDINDINDIHDSDNINHSDNDEAPRMSQSYQYNRNRNRNRNQNQNQNSSLSSSKSKSSRILVNCCIFAAVTTMGALSVRFLSGICIWHHHRDLDESSKPRPSTADSFNWSDENLSRWEDFLVLKKKDVARHDAAKVSLLSLSSASLSSASLSSTSASSTSASLSSASLSSASLSSASLSSASASTSASSTSASSTSASTSTSSASPLLYFNESRAFSLLNNNPESDQSFDDFYRYQSGWEAQITQSLCAVATTAAMLNSLRDATAEPFTFVLPRDPIYVPFPWATQSNLLDASDENHGRCVDIALGSNANAVRKIGLGLGTLPGFANCFLTPNGYIAEGYHAYHEDHEDHEDHADHADHEDHEDHASDDNEEFLKHTVIAALRDPHSRVLLNYDRGGIGQGPMGHGHWSPLGAYNQEHDSFLVMDVAKYKHPMVWVSWERLWGGVSTLDNCSTMIAPAPAPGGDKVAPPIDWTKSYGEIFQAVRAICRSGTRGFVVVRPMQPYVG